MNSNLMRATGVEPNLQKRASMCFTDAAVFGKCLLATLFADCALHAVLLVSPNGQVNDAEAVAEVSAGDGEVDLVHAVVTEVILEFVESVGCLGDDHHAGSILVQSMDDAWADILVVRLFAEGLRVRLAC